MPGKKNPAAGAAARSETRIGRSPGRPAKSPTSLLDKTSIIACALDLAKTVPLQDVSIVMVSRALGVTPALLHYYLGSRDALTSGVMNAFYRLTMRNWPNLTGDWKVDIKAAAYQMYRTLIAYPGVAAYTVSKNRFRMAQLVAERETDYGILQFERFIAAIRNAGFDPARTAMYGHLIVEFVTSSAHATVRHRWPGEHGKYLDGIFSKLPPEEYPNAHYVSKEFVKLNGEAAFAEGLRLLLRALELEQKSGSSEAKKKALK